MNVTITCRLVDADGNNDRYQPLLSMDGAITPEVSFDAFKSSVMKALNDYLPDTKVFRFTMSLDFREVELKK